MLVSPTRSAIFDTGETSRINVGWFMADLITDLHTWNEWKGKMTVIYNLGRDVGLVQNIWVFLQIEFCLLKIVRLCELHTAMRAGTICNIF